MIEIERGVHHEPHIGKLCLGEGIDQRLGDDAVRSDQVEILLKQGR